jgi:hypothetical protein
VLYFFDTYLGISILSTNCCITASQVIPSISFSGVKITRCLNTGAHTYLISSGLTKSLPLKQAQAFAAFNMAIEALGDAPKYKEGF